MAFKHTTINLKDISKDSFLRNDEKYHIFANQQSWNLFNTNSNDLISLKDILVDDYNTFEYEEGQEYKGIPTGQSYIDEDGEILDFVPVSLDDHPGRIKYKISSDNVLISSLRLAKTPALLFENNDLSQYIFSNGFYIYRVNSQWNRKFILYVLRTKRLKKILDCHIYRGIGISSYKDIDLKKIKIPHISKSKQDKFIDAIKPIEQRIRQEKIKVKKPAEIINRVFAKEFGFNLQQFDKLKKIKSYNLDFSSFANNRDLRQSVKFHREAARFVLADLKKCTDKKLKDYISEPIVLGKGLSPADYDETGEYYYISMANIKNWKFEGDETNLISSDFSTKNSSKSVRLNDILIARSGEGTIGKIALIQDEDLKGIFADFVMRIRLKNYDPLFAYYYFRTDYFQYLIEINKKGLGNNTNIFPSQIQEFPLIDIPLKQQSAIVKIIKQELDEQDSYLRKIQAEREKIDSLLERLMLS